MSNKIENLIIHCSDSPFGDVEVIRNWHINDRGWRDIGYSVVILNGYRKTSKDSEFNRNDDGLIENGRGLDFDKYIDDDEKGAHAAYHNHNSIGLCLIGKDKFTIKQFESLYYFVEMWRRIVPDINVIGHCDVDTHGKTCPNFNVKKFLDACDNISIKSDLMDYMNEWVLG